MGRVAERAEVGVVGRLDDDAAAVPADAVHVVHRRDHIGDVLDHVNQPDFVENIVAKGQPAAIDIADHVRVGIAVTIDSKGARLLVAATSNIKDPR